MRRRKLLAISAAATAGVSLPSSVAGQDAPVGEILVGRLRDAMLGIGQDNELPGPEQLPMELARVHADFHT